jgi:hypothetical protein
MLINCLSNELKYAAKADFTGHEGFDRDLIGGVHDGA